MQHTGQQYFLFRQYTIVHAATERTPGQLMFDRKLRKPLDRISDRTSDRKFKYLWKGEENSWNFSVTLRPKTRNNSQKRVSSVQTFLDLVQGNKRFKTKIPHHRDLRRKTSPSLKAAHRVVKQKKPPKGNCHNQA